MRLHSRPHATSGHDGAPVDIRGGAAAHRRRGQPRAADFVIVGVGGWSRARHGLCMRMHPVALAVFGHPRRSLWSYRMVGRCFLDLKLSLDHDFGGPEGQRRGPGPVFARRKMIPTFWNRGVQ